jgi:RluA family pseudouridine synthase
MQTFRVEDGGPLLAWLARVAGSRTRAKKWLRDRQVIVNGEVADRHDFPLSTGDNIRIGPPRRPSASARIGQMPVVYQDDAILVVEKPAGLLTIATQTERSQTAYFKVGAYLKSLSRGTERPFIVHRLDRETSGLLVFALTEEAKRTLQDSWEEVEKRYFAIVQGAPGEPSGTIESWLTEGGVFKVFSGPKRRNAKHAVTHYNVLASTGDRALLEVRTDTGRKHQIRVHLAEIGHPIVGDDKYSKMKRADRLGLHASYLKFRHPTTGEWLEFHSPLPRSLSRAFPKLRSSKREEEPRNTRKDTESS